jgi:PTH1 family peptidyl-tRNA hydrolase
MTRHNTGFWTAEALAEYLGFSFRKPWFKSYLIAGQNGEPIKVVKPLTYMNLSGRILPGLQRKYKISSQQLITLVDQMDLAPGQFRMRRKGSNAGHNGLKSMESFLGTQDYPRLYIGIGRPVGQDSVIKHVLDPPLEDEGRQILQGIKSLVPLLASIPKVGIDPVMSEINGRFG